MSKWKQFGIVYCRCGREGVRVGRGGKENEKDGRVWGGGWQVEMGGGGAGVGGEQKEGGASEQHSPLL